MGVWIETTIDSGLSGVKKVTPCMGVWIETSLSVLVAQEIHVTPCMGVWIETPSRCWILRQEWVTPCMGVWIETHRSHTPRHPSSRHTLYGCVDWNRGSLRWLLALRCHTLYGCVDWNWMPATKSMVIAVTPCMGVWIETSPCRKSSSTRLSHTLYGCVDWNPGYS